MSNESRDLSTLDREALARMVAELQAQIDCGVSPRDGCLNPKDACRTCLLADANREARKQARDAGNLEMQLAAFKQALCQRGENPDELTPQKAFEFVQLCYDLLANAEAKRKDYEAHLAAARAEVERLAKQVKQLRYVPAACPCHHTTPCNPDCTCVHSASSRGCDRCCSYGGIKQQRAMAERLAGLSALILAVDIAAIVAASAETTHAVRSDPSLPCCPECNEEKNLAYLQTNAEAEEWECRTCRTVFQFKPPADEQEGDDGK